MSRHENPREKLRRSLVKAPVDRDITSARRALHMYVSRRGFLRLLWLKFYNVCEARWSCRLI